MRTALTGSLLLLVVSTGCTAPGAARGSLTRHFADVSPDEAYAATQIVLREHFRRVTADHTRMKLESQPVEYRTSRDSGTSRDLYRGSTLMRRTAHASVSGHGDAGATVRLRIEIERQDTRRAEVIRPDENRLTDAPGYTPIERDAATTREQNTVWTFVRRDLRLERELMRQIEARLAPANEAVRAPQPAEPTTEPTNQ
ncbi:MAG: hypothetical protein D6744_09490 [Planctomycetota bacterium]|nr:MAG: hypothetical protein D6744_09490 [Planctomycetota bacterium]